MIVIDTDVLAVYYVYKWDKRYSVARKIIEEDIGYTKATTIVNVLELTGIMSLAQNGSKARRLFYILHGHFNILYWKHWPTQPVWVSVMLKHIQRRLSLGDALIAWILDEYAGEIEYFVTWNTKHFKGRVPVEVVEPNHILE